MNHSFSSRAIGRELVAAIGEGDRCAFEAFYRMEYNNLLHFAKSYTREETVSEDIAQETLLRIWQARETLNPDGNIRALAFTIARNIALDFLRKKADTISVDTCVYLEDNSMDVLINSLDLEKLVAKTFNDLPDKIRRTFFLSRQKGLSNKEIAQHEKVTVKAVEYRIAVALRAFRKLGKNFQSLFF